MEKWILYAVISMFFAGFTSVIAKLGLSGISGELGLTVRTLFVSFFIIIFAIVFVPFREFETVSKLNLWWLGLSGVTTALSWIFYYKALKLGDVSTIALIDKYLFTRTGLTASVLPGWDNLSSRCTP
ncbi:EamA family transporter [Aeromonas veronii]|uniref:EamA family transporter n=1 Tax=Aeromonas veronii TaxID=654 RepID=UPI0039F5BB58